MYLTWRAPAAMALCALAVFVVPHVWFVCLWAVVLLGLIGFDVVRAPSPSHLHCQREPLDSIHLGESTTSTVVITNAGKRRIRGAVRDAWLPGAGPHEDALSLALEPHASGRLQVELHPIRRGFRRTDQVCLRSLGPLGLAGRQQNRNVPGVVRVLPAFHSRRELPSRLIQLREIDGHSRVRSFGRGSEFDSLREYVRGDDVRSIDWRATARHRGPILRTWRPERDRQVLILLDTSRLSAGRLDDTTRLDAGMDACLLVAALAGQAGDSVVWLAGARRIDAQVQVAGGARGSTVRPILTAMAPLESQLVEPDWRTITQHIRQIARPGALIVLVTPLSAAATENGLLPLLPALAARHRVLLASVADPQLGAMRTQRQDISSVYEAAAAERTTLRNSELAEVLERIGIGVLDLDAEHLPAALADRYLQLKRDGRL